MWMPLVILCVMMAAAGSCKRDVFDEDKYEEIVDSISPVDSVDKNHDWVLTAARQVTVKAPVGSGARMVQVLTANPRQSGDARVVGEAWLAEGETATLNVSCPVSQSAFYAALVDQQGRYTIAAAEPGEAATVDFSHPLATAVGIAYTPRPQVYTYCFEEEFPQPGDYDYNDVVLRISQERTGEREVTYHVELAAVGAAKQVGACMRLMDCGYEDIESVETVGGLSFNTVNGKDIPDQMMYVLKDKSLLKKGRNGEAVINLFVDAHWATGDRLDENFGMVERRKYNVTKGTSATARQMVPRTIAYVVKFKNKEAADNMLLNELDPFIVEEFNGGRWEVHTYRHRDAQVLYPYTLADVKNLPWALCIPSGTFRWPLHGVNIGFILKETILFGAYSVQGHSFGEWSMDRTKAQDWYLEQYATENQVF